MFNQQRCTHNGDFIRNNGYKGRKGNSLVVNGDEHRFNLTNWMTFPTANDA